MLTEEYSLTNLINWCLQLLDIYGRYFEKGFERDPFWPYLWRTIDSVSLQSVHVMTGFSASKI